MLSEDGSSILCLNRMIYKKESNMNTQQQAQQQRLLNLRRFILILTISCFICSVGFFLSSFILGMFEWTFICGDGCYFYTPQPFDTFYNVAVTVLVPLSPVVFLLGAIGVIGYRKVGKKLGKDERAEPL